jgi:methylenetetrahydrofolate dehydrogenase (NADP+)/methenyltetrahydrofolate cyclohydrolase
MVERGGPVLLKGSPVASGIYGEVQAEVENLRRQGIDSGLALVSVGGDPASEQYYLNTRKVCERLGITGHQYRMPDNVSVNQLLNLISALNGDKRISGVLMFLPLPPNIEPRAIINEIAPEKDVDGLGAISIGRLAAEESTYQLFSRGYPIKNTFLPCTPYGVIVLLEHYGIELSGKDVVIVGKSLTVGKSLALMMMAKGATVTVCHRGTRDLARKTRRADILCVAAGVPSLITGDMVNEGVVVVDIGINSLPDGRFVGDVDVESVSRKASHISPVPGGVGPVTIAILMKNTVISTKRMFNIT